MHSPGLVRAIALVLFIGLALALPAAAQSAPPHAYQGLNAVAIPYANGPVRIEHVPEIWLRLPGSEPRRFGMDTGSTGIVVSSEHYVPAPGDVDGGPGRIVYNSSGRVLHGTYWTTDVEIMQARERPAATARVQVLRVERVTCLRHARDCEPRDRPSGVAFMGVGFDRDGAQGSAPTAQRNPFVALIAIASGAPASSVRPGYIVGREGIHLGMTAALTQNFAFVKLAPKGSGVGGLPEWNGAPLTVSVDGVTGTGTSLMDTGINYMFLSPPAGTPVVRGRPAPNRTSLTIWLPGQNPPNATYAFTVGDWSNPLHPAKVEVVHDPGTFVNTGRMFLQGFDYLYDAAGGYVGYSWAGRTNPMYGSVALGR
ncbi:MAG TPA: hypothetical protein VLA02_06545 [Reyranella sp.]|nr:hypothetical protein [Reyranella sp.]